MVGDLVSDQAQQQGEQAVSGSAVPPPLLWPSPHGTSYCGWMIPENCLMLGPATKEAGAPGVGWRP